MSKFRLPLAIAALLFASPAVMAQTNAPTASEKMTENSMVQKESDHRASKLIGTTVYNQANENIGEVNDLVISSDKNVMVVVGVGGFLGMGERNIAVPMSDLTLTRDGSGWKIVVQGTKEALTSMPAYTYYKS